MPTINCRHHPDMNVTNWACVDCGEIRHGCEHRCKWLSIADCEEVVAALRAKDQQALSRVVSRRTTEMMHDAVSPEAYQEALDELQEILVAQPADVQAFWMAPCTEPGCTAIHLN